MEVFSIKFVARHQSPVPLQPSEQPLQGPATLVATQRLAVLVLPRFSRLGAIISIPCFSSMCGSSGSESYTLSPISRAASSSRKLPESVYSTSFDSCGEAEPIVRDTETLLPTAIAMISVPLPRLVLPAARPLLGRCEAAADETFVQVQLALVVQPPGQRA